MKRVSMLLLVASCRTVVASSPEGAGAVPRQGEAHVAAPLPDTAPTEELLLPADWQSLPAQEFERLLLARTPEEGLCEPGPGLARELEAALAGDPESALRAVVVLARARGPRASAQLLDWIERPPAAAETEILALAASAFERGCRAPDAAARLLARAVGPRAAPQPELRVACAAAALALGADAAATFLLAVLERPADWDLDEARAARLEGRAVEALARHLGTEARYEPWAPLAERTRERQRLAQLVAALRM